MPLAGKPLHFDKPLCASLDGFTLHAATRAGGFDTRAREALLKYVLRPPIAQECAIQGPDGLVRILLKHPFADGTVAIDLDPLSLLSRLAASVPAPKTHTVRYAGVLASASKLRSRIVPKPPELQVAEDADESSKPKRAGCRYRSWAELLRTLGIDAFACPNCGGRMRILALVRDHDAILGKSGAAHPEWCRRRVVSLAPGEPPDALGHRSGHRPEFAPRCPNCARLRTSFRPCTHLRPPDSTTG